MIKIFFSPVLRTSAHGVSNYSIVCGKFGAHIMGLPLPTIRNGIGFGLVGYFISSPSKQKLKNAQSPLPPRFDARLVAPAFQPNAQA